MTLENTNNSWDSLPLTTNETSRDVKRILHILQNLILNQEDENKPMNIVECSEFTGLAKPTIYWKCSRKQIPFHKNGKKLWFYKSEITEWIKGGNQKPNEVSASQALGCLKKKKGGSHA